MKLGVSSDLRASPLAITLASLFEHLPGVCFFIKDKESRFVHVNEALLLRLGLRHLDDIVGTTDFDRYPTHVADGLLAGDRRIMETGAPLIDHAEVLFDHSGRLEWFSTSKYPIMEGKTALGVAGITRPCSISLVSSLRVSGAASAVDLISENPAGEWRIPELAKRCGLSARQLHRQFLEYVKMSPQEFVLRSRIHAAAALLRRSDEAIVSLSDRYHFCDQSAFTRQFRRILGTTPAKYRKG
ncbi:MAG TPA: AraC family transcriptional regulator [Verrucomicrobiales bacterium]|nr:AraC family transcriptional regulator [Verrucomicrobiales bacterium]